MIRIGQLQDLERIVEFNYRLAKETEDLTLDLNVLTSGVKQVLTDPHKGKYYVYVIDGQVVGQLMITYEWSDWRNANFWWIQSVYVDENYRHQGIFKALYQHVQNLALNNDDVCGIRLYVEVGNKVAKKTYQSLGMKPSIYDLFVWEK